ncbi:hypothetical protein ACE21V_001956 [Salmonella enterica]
MQMLSNQRQLTLPHSCKCLPTKGNLHSPIRANAFRTKPPYTVPCEPCLPTKSNFHRTIHTNAFFKRHFSAAIEANAFIQKALFCRHWSKCFYTKGTFLLSIETNAFHLLDIQFEYFSFIIKVLCYFSRSCIGLHIHQNAVDQAHIPVVCRH